MSKRFQNKLCIRYTEYDVNRRTLCHRSDGPAMIYLDGSLLFYENGRYSGIIESDGRVYFYNYIMKKQFSIDQWGRKEW